MARYGAEGVRTVLVTCTGGEAGDILNPAADTEEVRRDLGRGAPAGSSTTRSASSATTRCYLLGYRDSGMPDTESNAHPDNFANADLDEATGRLVEIVRRERPQVIVGYARDRVLRAPRPRAGARDQRARVRAGRRPRVVPRARRAVAAAEALLQQRLHPASASARSTTGSSPTATRARWRSGSSTWRSATPRPRRADPEAGDGHDDALEQVTTTRIDVRDQIEVGRAALLAHRTQIPPDSFFFRVPLEVEQELHPWEEYVLARSLVDTGRGRGRVRDRPLRGRSGWWRAPEHRPCPPTTAGTSELDDALFRGVSARPHARPRRARPPQTRGRPVHPRRRAVRRARRRERRGRRPGPCRRSAPTLFPPRADPGPTPGRTHLRGPRPAPARTVVRTAARAISISRPPTCSRPAPAHDRGAGPTGGRGARRPGPSSAAGIADGTPGATRRGARRRPHPTAEPRRAGRGASSSGWVDSATPRSATGDDDARRRTRTKVEVRGAEVTRTTLPTTTTSSTTTSSTTTSTTHDDRAAGRPPSPAAGRVRSRNPSRRPPTRRRSCRRRPIRRRPRPTPPPARTEPAPTTDDAGAVALSAVRRRAHPPPRDRHAGSGGAHLGDPVLPVALARAAHHEHVAGSGRDVVGGTAGAAVRAQTERSGGTEGEQADERVVGVAQLTVAVRARRCRARRGSS